MLQETMLRDWQYLTRGRKSYLENVEG